MTKCTLPKCCAVFYPDRPDKDRWWVIDENEADARVSFEEDIRKGRFLPEALAERIVVFFQGNFFQRPPGWSNEGYLEARAILEEMTK